jgi:hypothetical protein
MRLSYRLVVARITELQLQYFQQLQQLRDLHLQHFAFGDCPSHEEMTQTGASNPDGTDAIAANSATKSGRLPVEINSASKDVSANGSLAPVWNFTSGTKSPFCHCCHLCQFSRIDRFSFLSHFSSPSCCAFRMAKSYKLSANSYELPI